MSAPRKSTATAYTSNANDLSILFAPLLPSAAGEVEHFLADASFALGRREADLARMLGVSRSTLSGWKSRGTMPESHRKWFAEEFAVAVLSQGFTWAPGDDYRHQGIEVALQMFRATDFNPFGLPSDEPGERVRSCYLHFHGFVRLGLFILHRLPWQPETVNGHLDHASALLASLSRAAAGRLFPDRVVSQ